MSNTRIWDQLKTTDPSHTKVVEFGRKFTSIDAHWQIQRMTEVFGPVGEGWTYEAKHSIERLADTMVIAIADVTICWREEKFGSLSYGPVRGTCEIWSQERKHGVLLYEKDNSPKMRLDDDAPKKAMTDALTKGLSHLGVSADVFLGLYDDNKYVQKLKQQFANGNMEGRHPPNETPSMPMPERNAMDLVDPADQHMVQGNGQSAYEVGKRQAAEKFVADALAAFGTMSGGPEVRDWYNTATSPKGRSTNRDAVERLKVNFIDLHTRLETAADEVRLRNAARLQ